MKFTSSLVFIFFCLFSWLLKAQEFTPTFSVTKKTTHKISKKQQYSFGYLEVLENRKNPTGPTIKLPVYIFKSRSKNPKKDPIIYTVGGPGETTMPSAQYMNYYKYLDDRDFILFEQRGTYYAKPHLDCPEWSKAYYESNLPNFDMANYDALFEEAAKLCRDRLVKKGINLDSYKTNEIAADINDLVTVLDIKTYNLLTLSYSTKIGQVLMRDYPDRIRSVVMDSPLPLEVNYDEESVANLLATLDKMFLDCDLNEKCNAAYPDLKKRFYDYLKDKTISPLEVEVENPKNGKVERFYLDGASLVAVFTLAETGDVPNIPFEINKLLNNDLTSVKAYLMQLFEGPGNGAGKGMRLSVWCAEENPFNSQEIIHQETNKYPPVKGLSPTTYDNGICEIWNVKSVAGIENEPFKSDIPVLLISGEYDNLTPVKWARAMTDNFSNSHHLIFKGWKHGPTTNWSNQCAMQAANDFFNNPKIKPNPACFAQIKCPEFKIN